MSNFISVLALIVGVGLAVAMRSAGQPPPLVPPPQLPGLSNRAAAFNQAWPDAPELSTMLPDCILACGSGELPAPDPWTDLGTDLGTDPGKAGPPLQEPAGGMTQRARPWPAQPSAQS